ncbi:MAG: hypothetical protein SOZ80_02810 [Prevotella sp.]|uniref:hypothetical protein n=1 Tax=Prevotella sp. TaxID=59823 RepID=UPI002A2E68FA|nr:hypothetical protein [Prevotella sp.]MDD7318300.1 hypothetical protein [Prevotellaceae bacterium]MDY4019696.1 hypothetical protein [Prevotella sp.]
MNSEDTLKTNFSKENPFRVPEDYFATLEKRIVDRLPEAKPSENNAAVVVPMWKKTRKYVAVAACAAIVFGGYVTLRNNVQGEKMPADNRSSVATSYDYDMERVVDYVMMDNEDFYAYLLDE